MKRIILFSILCIAVMTISLAAVVGGKEAKKTPQPPPPPPKTFEDGGPWVAVDQAAALERAHTVPAFVKETVRMTPRKDGENTDGAALNIADATHSYMVLDSPILNRTDEPFDDLYGPVRFMHLKHAADVGDCTACHHYKPADAATTDAAGGKPPVLRCAACHQKPFNADLPDRVGLKAAYHQQCMGCHEERKQGPVDCAGCHEKRVPDHKTLVKLADHPEPTAVTRECIRCHDDAATDMLTSAHWRWRGPSPYTVGDEQRVDMGKATNTINNFCVAVPSNWPRCTSCHAGYGWKDAGFDFTDKTRMDCLICHDTTGTYAKVPTDAGMPYPQLNLKTIAENVGKPSRKTCGDCHFQGGGGDAVKHGDMNGVLYYPSKNCDVHMGGMDFQCHECHETRNHKIPGRSLSVPVAEGSRSCEDCHSGAPHERTQKGEGGRNLLVHHLNRHTEHLHCQTCHSPVYAKCRPTKTWWDWSKAGDKKRKVNKDQYGMPDYSWKKGEFKWKESAKPDYLWYNGKVERYVLGDRIAPEGRVTRLTYPAGRLDDPTAKIYPFKPMRGRQMADAVNETLIVPHLFGPGGFWKDLDWQKAFKEGMKAAGLPYSGEFKWVETVMYWGLNHETMPADNALGCAQCHTSLTGEKTCNRCHQDNRHVDFKTLAGMGTDFEFMKSRGRDVAHLVDQTDYLDFAALGYKGDPIIHGGRFKQLPLGSAAEAGEVK